jgi:tetratricopeptide (TPR) repeat protein
MSRAINHGMNRALGHPLLRATLVLALLAGATSATRANVWQRTLDTTDASHDRYLQALQEGDHLVSQANAHGLSASRTTSLVDQALRAYRAAAAIRPDAAEPYFRIATTLDSFFVNCEARWGGWQPITCPPSRRPNLARAKETLEALEAFEAREPLDPRINEMLFERAILRTKLVDAARSRAEATKYLEGALADYVTLLQRNDALNGSANHVVWGNLAETYMMLGRIDEAIDAYTTAIRKGGDTSVHYGLAVALDRDERPAEALEVIRRQGPYAFEEFKMRYNAQEVFFVPAGEEYYYLALVSEAFGYTTDAITQWRLFLQSGAHPEFQHRAKAHLDALLADQKSSRSRPAFD